MSEENNPILTKDPNAPLTVEDLNSPYLFRKQNDVIQLQVDAVNVLEGKVDISTFDKKYQQKIKDYYRFSATQSNKHQQSIAQMTRKTWDVV